MTKLNGTEKQSKVYFTWTGKPNCTTGDANKKTGRLSRYGTFKAFSSEKNRREYLENTSANYAVAVNRTTGRGYDMGCSMWDYNLELDRLSKYELDYGIE